MHSNLDKTITETIIGELAQTKNYAACFDRCRAIIKELEIISKSRVIAYSTSFSQSFGVLDDDANYIEDLLRTKNSNKPLLLILSSPGGQAVAAEKILTVCRAYADKNKTKFTALIPKSAKSAATIIALGADKILMSDAAELGPIDPQIVVSTAMESGKITEQDVTPGKTKTTERKTFQPNINVIPAIRIVDAVDEFLHPKRFLRSLLDKKIRAQVLLQYAYDLYLMAQNELRLSENILQKIVARMKKNNGSVSTEFEKDLELFLKPDRTLSHNRPITLAELSETALGRDKFIEGYAGYFAAQGLDASKEKNFDELLWEYFVRTNTYISDNGNPISKVIEGSSNRFQLCADGQKFV